MAEAIRERRLIVPDHFDLETYGGLRRLVRRRLIDLAVLERAIVALVRLVADRVPTLELIRHIHALGPRFAVPDAAYVALARELDAELVTCDVPLGRAATELGGVRVVTISR